MLLFTTQFRSWRPRGEEEEGEEYCKLRNNIPFEFQSLNDYNNHTEDDHQFDPAPLLSDHQFDPAPSLSDHQFDSAATAAVVEVDEPQTLISKWVRAASKVSKIGKGLMNDPKARKLRLTHWLEAIDPRHRYGHNLPIYYDAWLKSETSQSFFHWLDVGEGKWVEIEECPRNVLQSQCVKYLEPKEREEYEVIVKNGRLVYRKSHIPLETNYSSKWIFVLSTTRNLYVGQKKKGAFHHSSFLSGGVASSAGRLIAQDGFLKSIWPSSGHYHPTEEDFEEFVRFLQENNLDLTNVKRYSIHEDDEKIESS